MIISHAMSQYIYYINDQMKVSNINRTQLDKTYYSVFHSHREHEHTIAAYVQWDLIFIFI